MSRCTSTTSRQPLPKTSTSVFLPLISKKNDDGGQGAPPAGWNPLRGDVLLVDGAGSSSGIGWTDFLYQVWWGHSCMYDGDDFVYESIADGVILQQFAPNWLRKGNKIWHGRTLNEKTRSNVVASLDAAKAKYGIDGTTPYNANYLDKITEEKFYCSQLVWRIHQGAGIDVDSNDFRYSDALAAKWAGRLDPIIVLAIALAAVAPDELYLDTDLQRVLEFTVQIREDAMNSFLLRVVLLFGLVGLGLGACGSPTTPLPANRLSVLAGESINDGKNRLTVVDTSTWDIWHTTHLPRSLAHNLDRDPYGRLWVGFTGSVGVRDDRLRIYSPAGDLLKEMHPCSGPLGTAFAAERAFVACLDTGFRGMFVVIDLQTLEVERTIELSMQLSQYEYFAVGAIAANEAYVVVTGGTRDVAEKKGYTGAIFLDPHRLEIVARLPGIDARAAYVRRIIPYDGQFYLLNGGNWDAQYAEQPDILVLDPGPPPTVTGTIMVARAPAWGDIEDGMLYVYHDQKRHMADFHGAGLISRVDLAQGTVTTWPLPDGWGGFDLRVIRGEVLLARQGDLGDDPDDGVYRFDPDTGMLTLLVDVPDATRLADE